MLFIPYNAVAIALDAKYTIDIKTCRDPATTVGRKYDPWAE